MRGGAQADWRGALPASPSSRLLLGAGAVGLLVGIPFTWIWLFYLSAAPAWAIYAGATVLSALSLGIGLCMIRIFEEDEA